LSSLCQKTNSPKTPDELLTLYKGREDVLLENLRKVASDKHEDTKNESPLNNGGVPDMPPAILGKRHILEHASTLCLSNVIMRSSSLILLLSNLA